jgi:hypothetical protein
MYIQVNTQNRGHHTEICRVACRDATQLKQARRIKH